MLLITLLIVTLFCFVGVFFLTAFSSAFKSIASRGMQIATLGSRFFYCNLYKCFFPEIEIEGIYFAIISALGLTRLLFAGFGAMFLYKTGLFDGFPGTNQPFNPLQVIWSVLVVATTLVGSFILGDFIPRVTGTRFPEQALTFAAPISSLFMLLSFPFVYIFLKISQTFFKTIYLDQFQEPLSQTKREIIDIIHSADLSTNLDLIDKKLIESVLEFKERIAREIMVPRVDVFSLPAETPIKEAAKMLDEEGFSRVPIYKQNVDEIVGVLMYKDVISKYMEYVEKGNDPTVLNAPISSIMKNVLFTPETKKISHLLQDFKRNKVHQAIVVDEYGGTEGIVTIEDILEEIVGEISDEYDEDEQLIVLKTNDGWIVDARLGILDAEERLGIEIPQEGDYDTVGGYIFHQAGTIPSKGFVIHSDNFELEILKSNDRCVEKVKIKPVEKHDEHLSEFYDRNENL